MARNSSEAWRKSRAESAKLLKARTDYQKVSTVLLWQGDLPEILDASVPIQRAARQVEELGLTDQSQATIMRMIKLAREVVEDPERLKSHNYIGQVAYHRALMQDLNGYEPSPDKADELQELIKHLDAARSVFFRWLPPDYQEDDA